MPDNVIRCVNWELLQELNTSPKDVKHFVGTLRCEACGTECDASVQVPLWAASPPALECPECEQPACLFVDPEELDEDGEPYDFCVILPEDR